METNERNELFESDYNEERLTRLYENEAISEVNEEFSLPDYVPEVRRVLTVRAQPIPENKYLNDTSSPICLELGGTVAYSVIYLDEEGSLCALPLSSTYETKAILNEIPSETEISTNIESVTPRVLAPRKLSIKSKLRSKILCSENLNIEPKITPKSSAEELFLQRKYENVMCLSKKKIGLDNIRINDKLDSEGGARPIWCDAYIDLNEVKSLKDSVLVRGEVTVKCLSSKDGEYSVISKTMSLNEEIEAEGADTGDMVRVFARCVSLALSSAENSEANEVFFDLGCELNGEVLRNCEARVLCDAYSTNSPSQESYKDVEYYRVQRGGTSSFSLNEEIKSEELKNREIITIFADPVYEKCEIKGQKASLLGKMSLGVILKPQDGENQGEEITFESFELPLKYELDLGKAPKGALARCEMTLGKINARIDNGRLIVNSEVDCAYSIYEKSSVQALSTLLIKADEKIKRESSTVRVCFPAKGLSLWDVAKKYHVTKSHIAKQNSISENEEILPKSLII